LGLPCRATQGSAGHQLSIGRPTVPERPLPNPGVALFEFTGSKSPKAKWRFTKAGEDWFCFAGLWQPMPDGNSDAFTLLTTEPGPDVAPIHDRQMVLFDRAD
jgi:hypothetical protein